MVDNILALIAATAILILIPGPNVALIVANSLKYGYRHGFMTVLGTTLGVGLQLLVVIGDSLWVAIATSARQWFDKIGKLRNKIAGGFLVDTGIGFALARKSM